MHSIESRVAGFRIRLQKDQRVVEPRIVNFLTSCNLCHQQPTIFSPNSARSRLS